LYTFVIMTPWGWHLVAETCRSWCVINGFPNAYLLHNIFIISKCTIRKTQKYLQSSSVKPIDIILLKFHLLLRKRIFFRILGIWNLNRYLIFQSSECGIQAPSSIHGGEFLDQVTTYQPQICVFLGRIWLNNLSQRLENQHR